MVSLSFLSYGATPRREPSVHPRDLHSPSPGGNPSPLPPPASLRHRRTAAMAATTRALPSRSTAGAAAAKAVLSASASAVLLLALVLLAAPRPTRAQDAAVATTGRVVINEIMYNENTSVKTKKGAAGETEPPAVRPEAHSARRVRLVLVRVFSTKARVINRFYMGVLESTRD